MSSSVDAIPQPRPGSLSRSRLVVLHRWLGLTAGIIFAIAAGSGAMLVYADELDALLAGPRFATTPGLIATADIEAAIERHAPGARLRRVIWPADTANTIHVRVVEQDRSRDFLLDAGSGALLQPRPQHLLLVGIRRLHAGLLIGPAGGRIVQLASVATLLSLAIGVVLWWPGIRRLASSFRLRLTTGLHRAALDLHQTLGVAALPLLVVMTTTGVLMEPAVMGLLSRVVDGKGTAMAWETLRSAPAATDALDIRLATAVRVAQDEVPDGRLMQVLYPAAADSIVEVRIRPPADASQVRVAVDRFTGGVLLRQALRYDPETNTRLHFGLLGGPVIRALYLVACAIGFSLLPTGVVVWWLKCRRPSVRPRPR